MEIGYHAIRTLVPTLMEWVASSRIQNHIIPNSTFIMWLSDSIQFNLSNLSDEYQSKHINPNLSVYSLSLIQNITPTLITWAKKNNINELEIEFRFKSEKGIYTINKTIKNPRDFSQMTNYLTNKST